MSLLLMLGAGAAASTPGDPGQWIPKKKKHGGLLLKKAKAKKRKKKR